MIKQLSDTLFAFSFTVFQPISNYGDDPYLDSLGAVSHLLPTHNIDDKEEFEWINDNHFPYDIHNIDTAALYKVITFKNIEDAMAFKLRWM